jgi:hypothetical protein
MINYLLRSKASGKRCSRIVKAQKKHFSGSLDFHFPFPFPPPRSFFNMKCRPKFSIQRKILISFVFEYLMRETFRKIPDFSSRIRLGCFRGICHPIKMSCKRGAQFETFYSVLWWRTTTFSIQHSHTHFLSLPSSCYQTKLIDLCSLLENRIFLIKFALRTTVPIRKILSLLPSSAGEFNFRC